MAKKVRSKQSLKKGWEKDVDRILCYQSLPYISKIIKTELVSKYHNDSLVGYFGIKKTRELIFRKYYWLTLRYNIKSYVKECDIYLVSKSIRISLIVTCNQSQF